MKSGLCCLPRMHQALDSSPSSIHKHSLTLPPVQVYMVSVTGGNRMFIFGSYPQEIPLYIHANISFLLFLF